MQYDDDDDLFDTVRIDNSRPPLRWLANLMGEIGGWAILRCAFADEDGRETAAKIYGVIYSATIPLYMKYGTFYKLKFKDDEWG